MILRIPSDTPFGVPARWMRTAGDRQPDARLPRWRDNPRRRSFPSHPVVAFQRADLPVARRLARIGPDRVSNSIRTRQATDSVFKIESASRGDAAPVFIIDMTDRICPGSRCVVERDGLVICRDFHHLTPRFPEHIPESLYGRLEPIRKGPGVGNRKRNNRPDAAWIGSGNYQFLWICRRPNTFTAIEIPIFFRGTRSPPCIDGISLQGTNRRWIVEEWPQDGKSGYMAPCFPAFHSCRLQTRRGRATWLLRWSSAIRRALSVL